MCSCNSKRLYYLTGFMAFLSMLLISFAVWMPAIIDKALEDGLNDFVDLSPSSQEKQTDSYLTFTGDKVASPVFITYNLFNVTNPFDVINNGSKPILQEVGPYVYRKHLKRMNLQYQEDQYHRQLLCYQEWDYLTFEPSLSNGDPNNDFIYTANLPFQGILAALPPSNVIDDGFLLYFYGDAAGYSDQSRLFAYVTVNNMLFGYQDSALKFFKKRFDGLAGNTTEDEVEKLLYDCVYTGSDKRGDEAMMRQYYQWNNKTYVVDADGKLIWGTPEANRVGGTDANHFARNLPKESTVAAFEDDLERVILLTSKSQTTYKGITLNEYHIDPMQMANATTNPYNSNFYSFRSSGLWNQTKTKENVPIWISKPHFLDVDGEADVQSLVVGLSPDRDIHETRVLVEPITGTTMRANKRVQINVALQPITFKNQSLTWFTNVNSNLLLPLAWLDEQGQVSDDDAHRFKSQVYGAQAASYYIKLICFIFAIITLLSVPYLLLKANKKKMNELEWNNNDEAVYIAQHLSTIQNDR